MLAVPFLGVGLKRKVDMTCEPTSDKLGLLTIILRARVPCRDYRKEENIEIQESIQ